MHALPNVDAMLRYTLKRLLSLVISLAVASLVIFAVIEIAPGDPASFMLGVNARPDTLEALRAELGLDVPKWQRYLDWVGGMLTGDFGTSYQYRTPVAGMIADRLWVSLPLALYALVLSTAIAIPAGIFAAARRGGGGDVAVMGATQLGIAIPNFWFAMMLVLVFAINLGWFSAGGFAGWDKGLLAGLHSLTLPAVALALPQAAILARVMRSALIETLAQTLVTNGTTTWIYTPSENQVVVNDFVNDEQTLTPDELFYDYPQRFDVESMETVEQDGETYYVMDLVSKEDGAAYQQAQAHVRASDAMITRMRLTDQNGTTITFDLTDIQLNPSLSADQFTFEAPDDAEIVDLRSS